MWGLWGSPTHLGTAALVLEHGKTVLFSAVALSDEDYLSLYITGTEIVSFQGDGRQDFVTGEKKYCQYLKVSIN